MVWADAKVHARRGDRAAAAAEVDLAVPLLPTHTTVAGFSDLVMVHDVVDALWAADIQRHVPLMERLVDDRLPRPSAAR